MDANFASTIPSCLSDGSRTSCQLTLSHSDCVQVTSYLIDDSILLTSSHDVITVLIKIKNGSRHSSVVWNLPDMDLCKSILAMFTE